MLVRPLGRRRARLACRDGRSRPLPRAHARGARCAATPRGMSARRRGRGVARRRTNVCGLVRRSSPTRRGHARLAGASRCRTRRALARLQVLGHGVERLARLERVRRAAPSKHWLARLATTSSMRTPADRRRQRRRCARRTHSMQGPSARSRGRHGRGGTNRRKVGASRSVKCMPPGRSTRATFTEHATTLGVRDVLDHVAPSNARFIRRVWQRERPRRVEVRDGERRRSGCRCSASREARAGLRRDAAPGRCARAV